MLKKNFNYRSVYLRILALTHVTSALLYVGCRNHEESSSEELYASSEHYVQTSLLKSLHRFKDKEAKIAVCVASLTSNEEQEHMVSASGYPYIHEVKNFMAALNSWLALLHDNPNWNGPRKVTFDRIAVSSEDCEVQEKKQGFTLAIVIPDESAWTKIAAVFPKSRAFAINESSGKRHFIYMEKELLKNQHIVTHEVGHVLGLKDLYDKEEVRKGVAKLNPPSIMRQHVDSVQKDAVLTEDDKMGINAVWNRIALGTPLCKADGYKENKEGHSSNKEYKLCHPEDVKIPKKKAYKKLVCSQTGVAYENFDDTSMPFKPAYDGSDDLEKCIDRTFFDYVCEEGYELNPLANNTCMMSMKTYEVQCGESGAKFDRATLTCCAASTEYSYRKHSCENIGSVGTEKSEKPSIFENKKGQSETDSAGN